MRFSFTTFVGLILFWILGSIYGKFEAPLDMNRVKKYYIQGVIDCQNNKVKTDTSLKIIFPKSDYEF